MKIFITLLSLLLAVTTLENQAFAAMSGMDHNMKDMRDMAGAKNVTEVKVKVKGLVCAFCARNIEKSFLKNPAVEKVKADLDTKIVTIDVKEGQQISDETVKEIITDAGYNVVKIER